ncbi:hypothetical protein Hanom_Chr16g01473991 [Helianthus anomalus]
MHVPFSRRSTNPRCCWLPTTQKTPDSCGAWWWYGKEDKTRLCVETTNFLIRMVLIVMGFTVER